MYRHSHSKPVSICRPSLAILRAQQLLLQLMLLTGPSSGNITLPSHHPTATCTCRHGWVQKLQWKIKFCLMLRTYLTNRYTRCVHKQLNNITW